MVQSQHPTGIRISGSTAAQSGAQSLSGAQCQSGGLALDYYVCVPTFNTNQRRCFLTPLWVLIRFPALTVPGLLRPPRHLRFEAPETRSIP